MSRPQLSKRRLDFTCFAYIFLRLNHKLCRFPAYTDDVWDREVNGPKNDREEFKKLSHFKRRLTSSYVFYISCCLLIVMRQLIYPLYTIQSVNELYEQLNANSSKEYSKIINHEVRFGCLITNCSELSKGNDLLSDLMTLPVFKLCFPRLRYYYLPMIDTNLIGMMMHSIFYFLCFMCTVSMPIIFHCFNLLHDVLLFIIAPEMIRRPHGQAVKRYLIERLTSLNCYYNNKKFLNERNSVSSPYKQYPLCEPTVDNDESHAGKSHLLRGRLQISHLHSDYSLLGRYVKNYIEDCMLFIRTEYYRPISLRQYRMVIIGSIAFILTIILETLIVSYVVGAYNEYGLERIDNHIRSMGCAIWRGEREYVKISGSRSQFTLLTILECMFFAVPISVFFSNAFTTSFMCLRELIIEISAQVDRLELVIELTDVVLKTDLREHSNPNFKSDEDDNFEFHELSRLHSLHMRSMFGIYYLTPIMDIKELDDPYRGQLRGATRLREIAVNQLVKHGCTLDVYLTAMVKAYIGVRTLARQVKRTSKNVTHILSNCYAFLFGIVGILIGISKKFKAPYHTSIEFAISALLVTNLIIVAAARVQIKSRRLLNQIWQIVAITSRFEDIRLRHLRVLYIKQAISLSAESGMTIKAFRVPVTYETMIQLTLWTSTLAILSFSH